MPWNRMGFHKSILYSDSTTYLVHYVCTDGLCIYRRDSASVDRDTNHFTCTITHCNSTNTNYLLSYYVISMYREKAISTSQAYQSSPYILPS